jgi:hypothetical protein
MQTRAVIPENAPSHAMSCGFSLTDILVDGDGGDGRITLASSASSTHAVEVTKNIKGHHTS